MAAGNLIPPQNSSNPPEHLVEITPNDATDMVTVSRALCVAVSGNVKVTTLGGETVTVYIGAGGWFSGAYTRVWATGTTATGIVAGY